MLTPVSDDDWYIATVYQWVALDKERGAYLIRSNGHTARGETRNYMLVYKGPQSDLLALAHAPVLWRKRIRVYYWAAASEMFEIADKHLSTHLLKTSA